MTTAFQPHPSIAARVDVIGRDRAPVLVIDHFAADPDRLVDRAEAAFGSFARERTGYPGIVAAVPEGWALSALDFLLPMLRRVFDLPARIGNGGCDFQLMTTPPAVLAERQRIPHFDVPDGDAVASVHFLCRPPFRGTAFFRHRATGFEIISPDRCAAYEAAVTRELEGHAAFGYPDGNTALFERIACYEPVYNRAIFFSAASLHSGVADASQLLAGDARTGRLTANMFLQFAR